MKGFAWFYQHGEPVCSHRWASAHAWCVVDLQDQVFVHMYAQKCKRCDQWNNKPKFEEEAKRRMAEHVCKIYLCRIGQLEWGDTTLPNMEDLSGGREGEHDESGCEMCRILGRSCFTPRDRTAVEYARLLPDFSDTGSLTPSYLPSHTYAGTTPTYDDTMPSYADTAAFYADTAESGNTTRTSSTYSLTGEYMASHPAYRQTFLDETQQAVNIGRRMVTTANIGRTSDRRLDRDTQGPASSIEEANIDGRLVRFGRIVVVVGALLVIGVLLRRLA